MATVHVSIEGARAIRQNTVGPSGSRTLVQLRAEVLGDSPDVGTATERGT